MASFTVPIVGGRLAGASFSGSLRGKSADIQAKLGELNVKLKAEVQSLAMKQRAAFIVGGHQMRGGSVWRPLRPSTLAKHKRTGWPLTPLMATGRLRGSIVGEFKGLTKRGKTWMYSMRIVAGASYGRFHATGFNNARTKTWVPPRPPIEITDQDVHQIATKIRGVMAGL